MDAAIFVVFSSPSGSTRRVAETIKDGFSRQNFELSLIDLGMTRDISEPVKRMQRAGKQVCLFIGSPVYRDMAVPPIVNFIEALPKISGATAVPFVTWGQACSGVALWQMGAGLLEKGFKIAAAAKIAAQHSLMWQTTQPAGKGRPDETDLAKVKALTDVLAGRFEWGAICGSLPLEALDYQPKERARQMKQKMGAPRFIVPKKVHPEKCTQCEICAAACPAAAIALKPLPEFGPSCFDCFNCIRLCPEDAIEPAISLSEIEAHIRERVRTIDEKPLTQIFL
jgi:ferredoxin/flavodoxin